MKINTKKILLLPFFLLIFLNFMEAKKIAKWTVITYIQADNDLAFFATHNINDMKKITKSDNVNVLVQWDKPFDNKTWRYKINPSQIIDVGTLNKEMGINPERELVNMMRWVKADYPAEKYMLILWNHGNGVIDRNNKENLNLLQKSWLEIPGFPKNLLDSKGILYDYSQDTFLTTDALKRVLKTIHRNILGKEIDILGMDACLMAMLEVAYQIKNHAKYLVAAENTEPGIGWSYSRFLVPLSNSPEKFNAKELAKKVVMAYEKYYKKDKERTLCAIQLKKIPDVVKELDKTIQKINATKDVSRMSTQNMINMSRRTSIDFAGYPYIDLYSFYDNLAINVARKQRKVSGKYKNSLKDLGQQIIKAQNSIKKAVIKKTVGRNLRPSNGLSIYYPLMRIDDTYKNTLFAKKTSWMQFLNQN
jgi:hypothetical protein